MTQAKPLFSAFGIEIEYMIVDRETLSVLPVADKVLAAAAGKEGAGDADMSRPSMRLPSATLSGRTAK